MNQRLVSQMAGPAPIQQRQMAGQQGQMAGQQVQMGDQQAQMGCQQGQLGIQKGQMGQQGQMLGQMGQAQMVGPDPIWTTCPNCKTEIVTSMPRCWISLLRLSLLLLHSLLQWQLERCVAYLPQVQLRHRKVQKMRTSQQKKPKLISPVSISINYFSV